MSLSIAPQIKSRANLGRIYSLLVSILLRTFRAWVASATVGTKVAVAALRGFPITDSIVPLTADFVGPSIWLIDLFLFVGTSTISCTVFLEVTGFKVPETSDFGEFNVLDFPG